MLLFVSQKKKIFYFSHQLQPGLCFVGEKQYESYKYPIY